MVTRTVSCARAHTMIPVILAVTAALATALPSYIAVPADQIAFVDLSALHARRVPRQTLAPPPSQPQLIYDGQQFQQYQHGLAPLNTATVNSDNSGSATHGGPSRYAQARPPDFGEYVDFGAHTGNNGAFGWYADYPINHNEDSYRK